MSLCFPGSKHSVAAVFYFQLSLTIIAFETLHMPFPALETDASNIDRLSAFDRGLNPAGHKLLEDLVG